MISLTDLYLLYNRARGSELISPEDLLWFHFSLLFFTIFSTEHTLTLAISTKFRHASEVLSQLTLPEGRELQLRKFKSGIIVIQFTALGDETITARVLEIIDREPYKSAGIDYLSLASEINLSLTGS